jgi:GNAT superfamily N-acetyltransferase
MAQLLASRQRADRTRVPALASAFEHDDACRAVLAPLLDSPWLEAVAAERDGELVGYLAGERQLQPGNSLAARWIEPHSFVIPFPGHAVAPGEDPVAVHRVLYAELAARLVAGGFFFHTVHIPAADPALQEAWVALGFGRKTTAAVRDTGPVGAAALPAGIAVHQAGPEDIEVVMALEHTLDLHHVASPIFWPDLPETYAAGREYQAGLLADAANAHFVAYRDGHPLGMQTFMAPGFLSPLLVAEKMVYLFQGVVEPGLRGEGLGSALLDHSMGWARAQGYQHCSLHFASANPSGAPFWLGHGFVPVEYTMTRRVDERVAWANGHHP